MRPNDQSVLYVSEGVDKVDIHNLSKWLNFEVIFLKVILKTIHLNLVRLLKFFNIPIYTVSQNWCNN